MNTPYSYTQSLQTVVRTLSPTIEISYQCDPYFTNQLIKYMAKGLVKVYDKDGNRIEVCYE